MDVMFRRYVLPIQKLIMQTVIQFAPEEAYNVNKGGLVMAAMEVGGVVMISQILGHAHVLVSIKYL